MGDLSKIFSKAYAESKAELAMRDMEPGHKEQLTQLKLVVDELDASPDIFARLEMQCDYLQLRVGHKVGGASVVLDVRTGGEGDRTAILFERPESRHSGSFSGDSLHDLRTQKGREDLCRQLARELSMEEVETPWEANLRSYAKKPSP